MNPAPLSQAIQFLLIVPPGILFVNPLRNKNAGRPERPSGKSIYVIGFYTTSAPTSSGHLLLKEKAYYRSSRK